MIQWSVCYVSSGVLLLNVDNNCVAGCYKKALELGKRGFRKPPEKPAVTRVRTRLMLDHTATEFSEGLNIRPSLTRLYFNIIVDFEETTDLKKYARKRTILLYVFVVELEIKAFHGSGILRTFA